MASTTHFESSGYDKRDIERLDRVVNDAVMAISKTTSLPENEVLEILENMQVEMVGEIPKTLGSMGNVKGVRRVDATKLSKAIEGAIEAISDATALDTDEITWVFSNKPGASVEDIVFRLHEKSREDRATTN